MKKLALATLLAVITATSSTAFASLDDTKQSIASQYGECRMVIDTDNQLWPNSEWDQKGRQRAKAAAYTYSFSRQGQSIQLEVVYTNDKPDAVVVAQRFTPSMAIKVKDFKKYFPEVYQLIKSQKAEAFASYNPVTRHFQEQQSPVTMGVVVKAQPAAHKGSYYTVMAFNIQEEGRLIKDAKFIDDNTYIREFTIERVLRSSVSESMESLDWQPIKNFF